MQVWHSVHVCTILTIFIVGGYHTINLCWFGTRFVHVYTILTISIVSGYHSINLCRFGIHSVHVYTILTIFIVSGYHYKPLKVCTHYVHMYVLYLPSS